MDMEVWENNWNYISTMCATVGECGSHYAVSCAQKFWVRPHLGSNSGVSRNRIGPSKTLHERFDTGIGTHLVLGEMVIFMILDECSISDIYIYMYIYIYILYYIIIDIYILIFP